MYPCLIFKSVIKVIPGSIWCVDFFTWVDECSENLVIWYFWVLKLNWALMYLNMIFFQKDWCFENRPYDLILPGLCMPDFESSHIGLIISWADNCIAIEVANQKLGPSPACKPKLQQAGIYYLVIWHCKNKNMFNTVNCYIPGQSFKWWIFF